MALAISFSIEIIPKSESLSSLIVDLENVLINFIWLKLRSALATVTGVVNNTLSAMARFGYNS